MSPDPQSILARFAELLAREFAPPDPAAQPAARGPGTAPTYEAEQLARGAQLLGAIAHEFDRAAHWRHDENRALRTLFGEAAPLVEVPALAAALREASAAGSADATDLRVSTLDRDNRHLRALLESLHAWVESSGPAATPAVAALGERIWAELRASTERRRTILNRF
jgi:hypothetical protein